MGARIHLTGASCAGVSTLGAALSRRLGVPQLDVDDFHWAPSDPPFSAKRPPEARVALIEARRRAAEGWILSGSCMEWGDGLVEAADLIVFLRASTETRLRRLDRREAERHGARIREGGDMRAAHPAFRDWAAGYETPGGAGRSLEKHERWLGARAAPVLRLRGEAPVAALVEAVLAATPGPASDRRL